MKITKECEGCGATHTTTTQAQARGWGRFCSKRCAALYKAANRNLGFVPSDGVVTLTAQSGQFSITIVNSTTIQIQVKS